MNKFPKKSNNSDIVKRIINAAKYYKQNLVGKSFAFLFEGRSVEVVFKTENFLHLCGVDTTLYPKDFYRKAVRGTLKPFEIGFSNVHPYRFADIKTKNLIDALSLYKRDSLIVKNMSTKSRQYAIGATDLETVICFDEQTDDLGNRISEILVPYSLRIEEIANTRFTDIFEVDYVLSKKYNEHDYNTVEFGDDRFLLDYLEVCDLIMDSKLSNCWKESKDEQEIRTYS